VVIELIKSELSNKSQRDSQSITVVTRWDYTEEVSPAFKRLIALLLEDKEGKRKDGCSSKQSETERQNSKMR